MSMVKAKTYIQGERSFEETKQKCCQYPERERIEAKKMLLDAADKFKRIYNRKMFREEGIE